MLGTTHWMTPTDAVPVLCMDRRSLPVVTGSKLIWLKVSRAVGCPLWSPTSCHEVPSQYCTTQVDGVRRPPPSSAQ